MKPPDLSTLDRWRKTAIFLVIGFLALTAVIAALALERIERLARASAVEALRTVLHTTREGLLLWEKDKRSHLVRWAESPEVLEATIELAAAGRDAQSLLASPAQRRARDFFQARLPALDGLGIFIIAADYVTLASMRDANVGIPNLIAEERRHLLVRAFGGETVFITPLPSRVPLPNPQGRMIVGYPTMFLAAPIRDGHGEVAAVLALRLDPSTSLAVIAATGRIGSTGETYFFDDAGRLVSGTRFLRDLIDAGLLPPGDTGIFSLQIRDPGVELRARRRALTSNSWPRTRMAESALRGEDGQDREGYRNIRGRRVLGVWLWDETLNLGMATEMEEREALESFRSMRLTIIAIVGATLCLSLALSFGLAYVTARTEYFTHLSYVDGLTGLANRRRFDEVLGEEWRRAARSGLPLSLVMLDIDFFKRYNDRYGHQRGDDCLRRVASTLAGTVRRVGDLASRYGGEEFAVLLPLTAGREALRVAETIRGAVAALGMEHHDSQIAPHVTVSVGVATARPRPADHTPEDPAGLVAAADGALYEAKRLGRDRVSVAISETSGDELPRSDAPSDV
jgi:diguanylate cyclase (GGDEF)-like protein